MKVGREIAEMEVNAWLDSKGINEKQRGEEGNGESVEKLIEAVQDGTLSIDQETFEITHSLRIPIENDEGETTISSLVYKPRLKVFELQKALKGTKGSDVDARLIAYISAFSGKPKGVIGGLDLIDYNIAQGIAIFFMV